jgi:hypothetical protein
VAVGRRRCDLVTTLAMACGKARGLRHGIRRGRADLRSASTNAGKTFTGVFRSDDRGATYTATDIVWVPTVELLRVEPSLLVPSNVSRSDDSGRTFTALFPGHPRVTWIASDPADARVLVALEVEGYGAQPPAMYRSADGGSTWARCLSGLDRLQVSQMCSTRLTVPCCTPRRTTGCTGAPMHARQNEVLIPTFSGERPHCPQEGLDVRR